MVPQVLMVEFGSAGDATRWESVQGYLDSGVSRSVLPAAVLARLGVEPCDELEFLLQDDTRVRRRRGVAACRLEERMGAADVLFGEEGDLPLIGSLTLGSLGLGLNPLTCELYDSPMLLASTKAVA